MSQRRIVVSSWVVAYDRMMAVDRQAALSWYAATGTVRGSCSTCSRSRCTTAADRPPASDRVLRRPPSGVQFQHAGKERARRAESGPPTRDAVRARHRPARVAGERTSGIVARSGDVVRAFAAEADARVMDALSREELDRPGHPLLDRAEAVFSILEHEAMHQETLLYMWHRLGFDKSTGRTATRRSSKARRPRGVDRGPRRARGPRRRPFRRAVRLGQRVPSVCGGRAGVFDPAPQRDQRAVPGLRRCGRLQGQPVVDRRGLGVGGERARRAPAVLGAFGSRVAVARNVRHAAAAAVVAGVREPRGGRGVRALARPAPAD